MCTLHVRLALTNASARVYYRTHILQLLFLAGVLLIIGPSKTYRFFFQKRKAKGTACFLGGIVLVLYGWAMIGIIIEGWGFLNLFGDFFPTALCAPLRSHSTFFFFACARIAHGRRHGAAHGGRYSSRP